MVDQLETMRSFDVFPGKTIVYEKFEITAVRLLQSYLGRQMEIEITQV
jgi:hypothetical protein